MAGLLSGSNDGNSQPPARSAERTAQALEVVDVEGAVRCDNLQFAQGRTGFDDIREIVQVRAAGEAVRGLGVYEIADVPADWDICAPRSPEPQLAATVEKFEMD